MPDAALSTLVDDLASPDPAVRDERAYAALAQLVGDGGLSPDDRAWLGAAMVERLEHPRVEARTFAPLVLAGLVSTGPLGPGWLEAVTRWYLGETELRGHDDELGWVHAVAHGADFFGECGATGAGDPAELLDTLARRMVAPTTWVWRDQEDDRLAYALALVLSHPDLTAASAVGWLDPVTRLFATGAPGSVPAEVSNTMRTLRSLHVALGEQVLHDGKPVGVPHADAVRDAVAAALVEVTPWFWSRPSS